MLFLKRSNERDFNSVKFVNKSERDSAPYGPMEFVENFNSRDWSNLSSENPTDKRWIPSKRILFHWSSNLRKLRKVRQDIPEERYPAPLDPILLSKRFNSRDAICLS